MKKHLVVLLTLFMTIILFGCNKKDITQPKIEENINIEKHIEDETNQEVGEWVEVNNGTLTNELKDIFNKGVKDLLGVKYTPITLLATQVANGVNYKFLADGEKATNPITKGTYRIVINKSPDKTISLLDIEIVEEQQETVKDITNMLFWVVFYDQFGNELQREALKYGTVPSFKGNLPAGFINWDKQLKAITGNTYIHAKCNDVEIKYKNTTIVKIPGIYKNGVLTMTWDEFMSTYSSAFDGNKIICTGAGTDNVFYNVEGDIVIDESITEIGTSAFEGCNKITSVDLKGVITIDSNAFQNCTSLTSVKVAEGLETMDCDVFCNCTSLTSFVMPQSLSSIDKSCFDNTKISSINWPSSMTIMPMSVFSNMTELKTFTIPSHVTKISASAFERSGLTSITIPSNVVEIGVNAFCECYNLTTVDLSNSSLNTITGFDHSGLTSVNIPGTILSIGDGAFAECANLTNITINSGVQSIGEGTFENVGATNITIPDSVTSIGSDAFLNVNHITYNGSATGAPWGALSIN